MSLFVAPAPALLAQRVVRVLATAKRPAPLASLRAAVGLPPRARRLRPVLEALEDAGIVAVDLGEQPARYRLLRAPLPGELDPPRREFHLLGEAAAGPGLEVRAVRFVDSAFVRIQVRRVRKFPSGAVVARHVLGLRVADARALAAALLQITERFQGGT